MQLKLWKNFSKRKNSTKRPADASATVLDVKLKQATSIENPVFILQSNEYEYNYAYALGHYYFINDIVSISNDLIEIHCSQDLLATYKGNIQNTSAFIEYASMLYNKQIADPRIAMMTEETITEVDMPIGQFNEWGTYILNVANSDPGTGGFTTTYLMNDGHIQKLAKYLMQTLTDHEAIVEWLQKTFLKTYDSIVSCRWIPVNLTMFSGVATMSDVYIGKDIVQYIEGSEQVTLQALKVTSKAPVQISTSVVSIPYTYTEDFRKAEPFTRLNLYLPFYGMVQLNPVDFPETITVNFHIDYLTGDITAEIKSATKLITTINYNIAVMCPIAQSSENLTGGITSIAGGVAGAIAATATGGATAVAGSIGAVVGLANGAIDLTRVSTSVKGQLQGNSMFNIRDAKLVITSLTTIDPEDLKTVVGRPVMTTRSLSLHSGYVKTANASVSMGGLGNDRDELNRLLDAGIYIE